MTVPLVADTAARLIRRGMSVATIREELQFREFPGVPEKVRVPTRHGDVACSLYRPANVPLSGAPVYVNAHGGGYIARHPEQDDPWCRYLAATADVAVLNVDYDVAPERPFPIAIEQMFDVVAWASAPDRQWDGSRLCVGGQSSGGGLAAAVARLALEAGGPPIALQVLHYPPLDLVTRGKVKAAANPELPSIAWLADVFDTAYARSEENKRNRLVSPAWGENGCGIEGIAPAVVLTCELDVLKDEGVAYARRLSAVGSLVEHHEVRGQGHAYNIAGTDRAVTQAVYDRVSDHVREAVAPGSGPANRAARRRPE